MRHCSRLHSRRSFLAGITGVLSTHGAHLRIHAQSRTARTVRFDSTAMGAQATFAVLLPPDYDTSTRRYPVVYLLHGGTQNHTAYPARRWFGEDVARRHVIAVMPHVPQSAFVPRAGAPAAVAFLTEDLVRYVDDRYRTIASRQARAIAGLSMGGHGAVLAGLARPDRFASVGTFSGAMGGARAASIAAAVRAMDRREAPFFYVACGLADPALAASREFVQQLRGRGIEHEYHEVGGGHTWDVWDPQTLAFLDVVTARPGFRATQ